MTDIGDKFALRLTSTRLAQAHAVWMNLAAGRVGPKREEITPVQLRGVTGFSFIIDVIDGGADFRFRFAGDRVIQFMGRRLAGSLLSEYLGTPFFDGMRDIFRACVAGKGAVSSGPSRSTYPGKDHLEMEVLVLPICDDGVAVTSLFGALDTWQAGTHGSGV